MRQWIAAALLAVPAIVSAQTTNFVARLTPVPIDVAAQATISGIGSATATLTGVRLTIDGKFEGLRSPATVARLHMGLTRGVRGPAIGDLTVTPGVKGALSGSVDLTAPQAAALRRGAVYIQIHSEKAPDGNLWGWLLPPSQKGAK